MTNLRAYVRMSVVGKLQLRVLSERAGMRSGASGELEPFNSAKRERNDPGEKLSLPSGEPGPGGD
jgi:hypothetical protein